MPLTVKSNGEFVKRLQEIKAASVEPFVAHLQVPDDLFWWKFLEYGTGERGDINTGGYTIEAVNAKMLHFFQRTVGGELSERFEESVFMPGIPSFHIVTSIYGDIQDYQKSFLREALVRSDYNMGGVKELVYSEMMPHIKELIIDSFRENLPNEKHPLRELGRLSVHVSEAMENGLEIV